MVGLDTYVAALGDEVFQALFYILQVKLGGVVTH